MSVAELKERHAVATETVNTLRERLKQKRRSLLDTDGVPNLFCLVLFCFALFIRCFSDLVGLYGEFCSSRVC